MACYNLKPLLFSLRMLKNLFAIFGMFTSIVEATPPEPKYAYFVSHTRPELRLLKINDIHCVDLVRPPSDRYIGKAHIEIASRLHWSICRCTDPDMRTVGMIGGQTVEARITEEGTQVGLPEVDPLTTFATGSLLNGTPTYINKQQMQLDELIRKSQTFVKTAWPNSRVKFDHLYTSPSDIPLIEFEVSNVRGLVVPEERHWENLHVIVSFFIRDENSAAFVTSVEGQDAAGLGSNPPMAADFKSIEQRYSKELSRWRDDFIEQLRIYLQSPSPDTHH